jgi:hypothetical protein
MPDPTGPPPQGQSLVALARILISSKIVLVLPIYLSNVIMLLGSRPPDGSSGLMFVLARDSLSKPHCGCI